MQPPLYTRCLAEFIGTFALVLCGTGAVVVNEVSGGAVGHLGICIVFGAIVSVMIYSFGHISGTHINPGVTIAFWAAGGFIAGKHVVPYIISQLAGAAAASLLLLYLFPDVSGYGATNPAGSVEQSFVLEVVITFLLMLTILMVASGPDNTVHWIGLSVGATVALLALFGGPISGASMNTARSFGPALVEMKMGNMWLYTVAPVMGALLSVPVWKLLKKQV